MGNIKQVLAEYLATGLDPEVATIYLQSDIREISELYLLMNMNLEKFLKLPNYFKIKSLKVLDVPAIL